MDVGGKSRIEARTRKLTCSAKSNQRFQNCPTSAWGACHPNEKTHTARLLGPLSAGGRPIF